MSNKTTAVAKLETKDVTISTGRMTELEKTVREGQRTFITVGAALMEIRDTKGYKLRGYKTFEEYTLAEMGIGDRYGRRIMQATETAQTVKQITGAAPASESVARELAPVVGDPKKVEKVAAALQRKGLTVATATAEVVKEAVQKVNAKPAAPPKPAQAPLIPVELEPLDLNRILDVLNRVQGFVRDNPILAEDVRRANRMVRAELARLAGEGKTCKNCGATVTPLSSFCDKCGELQA